MKRRYTLSKRLRPRIAHASSQVTSVEMRLGTTQPDQNVTFVWSALFLAGIEGRFGPFTVLELLHEPAISKLQTRLTPEQVRKALRKLIALELVTEEEE
jgi:hypothetical protein